MAIFTVLSLTLALGRVGTSLAVAAEDLGTPPAGQYPIIFNNRTVYAKPDVLKENRVLAALVKDGHIYVPLRSMFEEMGATVTVSPDGKTITAIKSGVNVSVTLDKPEVVVNGETRPLDVPPMLYEGVVLVPVRVLSEALGAYVQWVGSKEVVVVRYIPPPPPLAPPPTLAPTAAPTLAPLPPVPVLAPTAAPTERAAPGFVQAAITVGAQNFNEFSAGQFCYSWVVNGAYAFGGSSGSEFALKVDYRHDSYVTSSNLTDALGNQYTHFATIDGGMAYTPVFLAQQSTLDARAEFQVASPRIYVGAGYLYASTNYGYPHLSGFGGGIEKLPELRAGLSFYGSAFYYPSATGNYTVSNPLSSNFGTVYNQRYGILKYDIGIALAARHLPVYLYGGYGGDRYYADHAAPIGQIHDGPYVGLGVKL
ncbi:MAG: copper amine oxidase N-terminal domain-containing protein [Vulcanimicrobiaceae bacterium]